VIAADVLLAGGNSQNDQCAGIRLDREILSGFCQVLLNNVNDVLASNT
jgi:hypothetical protein